MFPFFLILTVLWFIFMTYLSHQDGEHTGKTSREFAEKLSFLKAEPEILNCRLRKAAHVAVFLILTVLLGITLHLGGYSLRPMIFAVIWSYLDEATKPLVEGRHFSWFDVGLNLAGVAAGIALLAAAARVL